MDLEEGEGISTDTMNDDPGSMESGDFEPSDIETAMDDMPSAVEYEPVEMDGLEPMDAQTVETEAISDDLETLEPVTDDEQTEGTDIDPSIQETLDGVDIEEAPEDMETIEPTGDEQTEGTDVDPAVQETLDGMDIEMPEDVDAVGQAIEGSPEEAGDDPMIQEPRVEETEGYEARPNSEQMIIDREGNISSLQDIMDRQNEEVKPRVEETEGYEARPNSEQMIIDRDGNISSLQDIMDRQNKPDTSRNTDDYGTVIPWETVNEKIPSNEYQNRLTETDKVNERKDFEFYEQGNNEFGYLGTCGPTTVANTINSLMGERIYTENDMVNLAVDLNLCQIDGLPDKRGGTDQYQLMQIFKQQDKCDLDVQLYDYGKALKPMEIAEKIEEGSKVAVAVDSTRLASDNGDIIPGVNGGKDIPSDHWITVTGVDRKDGKVVGFSVIDSSDLACDYVDINKFDKICFGDSNSKVTDPISIIVSKRDKSI